MGLLDRARPVTDAALGVGTPLHLVGLDGQTPRLVTWTKDRRRVLDDAQPTLRLLRAAGIAGEVQLRTTSDGCVEGEVHLGATGVLRFVVHPGTGFSVVPERDALGADALGFVETIEETLVLDPERALGELVFAVSSLTARDGDYLVRLPGPVSATRGSVQLLGATEALPARWALCVFVTRDHDVPHGADEEARRDLWVQHSVGVKMHLDGTVAVDPDDDDPTGDRSRTSLATASGWAGELLDLVPYARWLVKETERRLGRRLPTA